MLSHGPKLTNRRGSSTSRSSIARAASPWRRLQSAHSLHRTTNSLSRPSFTSQFVCVYGPANARPPFLERVLGKLARAVHRSLDRVQEGPTHAGLLELADRVDRRASG